MKKSLLTLLTLALLTTPLATLAAAGDCTGGTITHVGPYTIHTFTSTGSTTFTCTTSKAVEYLVVAGGGGGGGYFGSVGGGGGGAGGLLAGTGYSVAKNSAITVTVGAGGLGSDSNSGSVGTNGGNSVFGSITALGGGASRAYNGGAGFSGGSGAGSSYTSGPGAGTVGQGHDGGAAQSNGSPYVGSGGGGAGSVGGAADRLGNTAGNGGSGISSAISGSSVSYAGGGGGGADNGAGTVAGTATAGGGNGARNDAGGTAATANTGGGGSGGWNSVNMANGNGGSGIVIVRYLTPVQAPVTAKFKSLGKISLRGVKLAINATPTTYIENVFSAYNYTGNGSTQTIANGVNLTTGLTWIKARSYVDKNLLFDTIHGALNFTQTDSINGINTTAASLTAFNTNGFSLGSATPVNGNADQYASWSFAQAPKFFKTAVQVHTNGVANTISLASLGTVGMVAVKSTVGTSAWFVWHRSLTAGKLVYFNSGVAETADTSISVSGTTLTLSSALPTDTYIIYAWAHDPTANSLIKCGSWSGAAGTAVTLGWEPQYVIFKNISTTDNWGILDTARGWRVAATEPYLNPDTTGAEWVGDYGYPTATGFVNGTGNAVYTYVYCAVRRGPMQQPSSGTQVYSAVADTGTGAARNITGVGFPPDLTLIDQRSTTGGMEWIDRLRGRSVELTSVNTAAETSSSATQDVTSFNMDGISLGTVLNVTNTNAVTQINYFFRRHPGVFDEVAYTGNGTSQNINHNLGVTPELMIARSRSNIDGWWTYHSVLGTQQYVRLDTTTAVSAYNMWGTGPTATYFPAMNPNTNGNAQTYVAYLFASKPGISKVGSYTGNGSTQNINARFTATARFVMIKRTDTTGDWYVWDSTRGITAGANDPHLSLNTTAAEVTTDDSIDPYISGSSSGFTVNQNATTNVNVTNATYIYLAFQ